MDDYVCLVKDSARLSIPNFIGISAKAYGQRPPARGLCTRALLSETLSPRRVGMRQPWRLLPL
ncbi:hypothetical protein ERL64_16730 [Hafnia alvei]|nr:hypothetical protein ERL64_16730 [Hafnia alvei]